MRVAVEPVLLACCAVEAATALAAPQEIDGVQWVDVEADVTVVVLAGTITIARVPELHARIDAIQGPKAVVAFGVCAASGGPYWDSAEVVQGWPAADLLVPGCPPPPQVLWSAVAQAAEQVVAHEAV